MVYLTTLVSTVKQQKGVVENTVYVGIKIKYYFGIETKT